ncbi:MAG: trehalose-phosphatase [Desulfuromonadales bacterium]|nr:trehalose-phosphatase [Desulfuromonadales bacterium]
MTADRHTISREQFDAVIFDMDGVVTKTAHVHAAAWKKMFDDYLAKRAQNKGDDYLPFSVENDYTRYVDGKPRYDGVRDFLRSRGIELPEGSSEDSPDRETIRGLGNRKNSYFQQVLEEKGAQRYETTADLIAQLRKAGIKTAIISASKNARAVLASADATDLFDARVDGLDAEEMGIPGKPAADVFLAAAKKLGATPRRSVVVEDAQSGVQAGRAGNFGLVIGVDRADQTEELAKYADIVVKDLAEIRVEVSGRKKSTDSLPSALDRFNDVTCQLKHKRPAVFLDYDGTLTPIVERPEDAIISEEMRQTVRDLAKYCTVAIVSGRDRKDVEKLAGIEGIYYAGSHGFDIAGPAGKKIEFQQGNDFLPALDRAEQALHERLDQIERTQVERKKFAIAIHFRRVAEEQHAEVETAVDKVLADNDTLKKTGGKMIFELRPDIDWDKGKALSWLLQKLELNRNDILPLYIGDDLTDEDALREIEDRGIGILVRDEERETHGRYVLEDTCEVRLFLQTLCNYLEELSES